MKFREFLNETPLNIGDLSNSKSRLTDLERTLIRIENFNLKKKSLFGGMTYSISDQYFIIYSDESVNMYIRYTKRNNTMVINVVENISGKKGLQFKVLSFILESNIFKEIETGDALSKANIKSHLKYLKNGNFTMFVRLKDEDIEIESEREFMTYMKGFESFVLKSSNKNKKIQEMYNSTFSIVYNDLLGEK